MIPPVKLANGVKALLFCLLKHPIRQLHGLTMTIVGFGSLGQATAKLAEAFGMRICLAERPNADEIRPGRVAFAQALATADVLSLHCLRSMLII